MESSKIFKSPKLNIVLQRTEITPSGVDGRAWEVYEVERNRGFRITLSEATLRETPAGIPPLDGPPNEDEIHTAIGLAIERALVTPPEKIGGTRYDVPVTSQDLREAAALARPS